MSIVKHETSQLFISTGYYTGYDEITHKINKTHSINF
jgi:hypothetical protein